MIWLETQNVIKDIFECFKLKFLHTAPFKFVKHASTPNVMLANGHSGTYWEEVHEKGVFRT